MSINLNKLSTRAPKNFDKEKTKALTAGIVDKINSLQNLLYAESKHSVLVVIQGMDASGKDGLIRDIFGKLNPQGVLVNSFKVPTAEELAHDFLWRIHAHAPAKGVIQVFNRSHYEDIIVTRVHALCTDAVAKERMKAINDFEELLERHSNTHILKIYLHISPEEQQQRLEERVDNPEKNWKYNPNDLKEAKLWNNYMKMYEDCFKHCNLVPWQIVPSDQNWYKEYLVADALYKLLEGLKMKYPLLKK